MKNIGNNKLIISGGLQNGNFFSDSKKPSEPQTHLVALTRTSKSRYKYIRRLTSGRHVPSEPYNEKTRALYLYMKRNGQTSSETTRIGQKCVLYPKTLSHFE